MKSLKVFVLLVMINTSLAKNPAEQTTEYWNSVTDSELLQSRKNFEFLNTNKAKNVIMIVGDGMSLSTVTAGRIAIGQKFKKSGEEHVTSLDEMPYSGLLKTYSINYQTPDSASTATAFMSGVKTNTGYLGVNAKGSTCLRVNRNSVKSSLEYAAEAGKATGVITTTRVQHATPAASYAHVHKRSLYSDQHYRSTERRYKDRCPDISMQLFNKRKDIQVIMGGGRAHMLPINVRDPEYNTTFGERRDGRNLINEWVEDLNKDNTARYVWNKTEFEAIDPESTDFLMGLFSPYDTEFGFRKRLDKAGEPSLPEMTEKAIKILRKNKNGFFLLIESGLIDKGHHMGRAQFAIEEFYELEKSLDIAKKLTQEEDTLIVTTADHGHMFMFGGYSVRGNNVYGLAPSHLSPRRAPDGKYFTSILYGNGPGYAVSPQTGRQSVSAARTVRRWYRQQSAVPLASETHSAEDVIVLGSGPMAHLFNGVHEQTHVASVVQFAACLGEKYQNEEHCQDRSLTQSDSRNETTDGIGELNAFVADDWMFE